MSSAATFSQLAGLYSDHIAVHQERCVMVRNRKAECGRCADVCTTGCISLEDGAIAVEQDKCIGCGTCATACPTGAVVVQAPNDATLLSCCKQSAQHAGGRAVIACRRLVDRTYGSFDLADVTEVTCLGRVDESLLVQLVTAGIDEVVLACAACDTCEHVEGRYECEQVCQTTRTLLDAWNCAADVAIVEGLPTGLGHFSVSDDGAERRVVAEHNPARDDGSPLDYRQLHVMADGTLPHFIPDRRERLLDALSSLGEAREVPMRTRLWGHVDIDTRKCTSCRACAIFCPTGALRKFDESEEVFGVEHFPGDCVKCLCCEEVCPTGALHVLDEIDAPWVLGGKVEHVEMPPIRVKKGGAHSIVNSIRDMIGIEEVYER